MNELILIIQIIITFSSILIVKKLFNREGLIALMALFSVLANLLTAKNGAIFGLNTSLGSVLFASSFLITDILNEYYTKEDAKKAVNLGFIANIIFIISSQITLWYIPSNIDYVNEAMKTLLSLNIRISISSMIMYYIANHLDIYIYSKLKNITNNKLLWLRNNFATILCNCLENFGFIILAFGGIYDIKTILNIAISTSIIEIIIALCDTPFLYLAKKSNK